MITALLLASEQHPCPAEVDAKVEAAAARAEDLAREALDATERTLADGRSIAEGFWDGSRADWLKTMDEQSEAFLRARGGKASLNDWISGAACRALATGSVEACEALTVPRERESCGGPNLLRRVHGETGGDCSKAPERVRGACEALEDAGAVDCAAQPAAGRAPCELVRDMMRALPSLCGEELSRSACLSATAALSARLGAAACERIGPKEGEPTPAHRAVKRACEAIAAADPRRCPSGGLGDSTGVTVHVAVQVLPGREGPYGIVHTRADSPSICHIAWTVRGGEEAVDSGVRVRTLRSWERDIHQVAVPADLRAESTAAEVAATCLPWIGW